MLKKELVKFDRWAVKGWHLAVVILVALAVGLTLGFLGGYSYPYKTIAPPPIPPGQVAPKCDNNGNLNHTKGECLPKPKAPPPVQYGVPHAGPTGNAEFAASIEQSQAGPDLSNNDPVCSDGGQAAIAGRSSFEIDKASEGTNFKDGTLVGPNCFMISLARRHGLAVGGYDFLHVCGVDPASEAHLFTFMLQVAGLTGPPGVTSTFPPVADAEFGGDGCDARQWMHTWYVTVQHDTGRWPMTYTAAWWWDPHLGCWWDGGLLWDAGYTGSLSSLPRLCGHNHVDMWQFSDNWWNGASSGDGSLWLDGYPAFHAATSTTPPDPYALYPKAVFALALGHHASEYNTVKTWDSRGCENPVVRPVCKSTILNLKLLRDRAWWVHLHRFVNQHGHWVWVISAARWDNGLGRQFGGINHRITMPTGQRCNVRRCG